LAESENQADELERLQLAFHEAEQAMESVRETLSAAQQRRESLLLRRSLAEEQKTSLQQRLSDLQALREKLNVSDDNAPSSPNEAEKQVLALEKQTTSLADECRLLAENVGDARASVRTTENQLVSEEAQYTALRELATEKQSWQEEAPPRLADTVQLQAGKWAVALDAVLGRYADGHTVESIDSFLKEKGLPPSGAALVEIGAATAPTKAPRHKWQTLLSHIKMPAVAQPLLATWLSSVYTAENLKEAQVMRLQLAAGETVVIRDGIVFTRESVFMHGEMRGGFDWQQRLSTLTASVTEKKSTWSSLNEQMEAAEKRLDERKQAHAESIATLETMRAAWSERRIAYSQWEERQRATAVRQQEISDELSASEARLQEMNVDAADVTGISQAEDDCTNAERALLTAKSAVEEAATALEKCRSDFHHLAVARRELHVREENLKQRGTALELREEEWRRRRDTLQVRGRQNENDIAGMDETTLASTAQQREAQAVAAEKARQQVNTEVAEWEQRITTATNKREQHFTDLQKLQENHAALQVAEKEAAIQMEGLNNALEEFSVNEERLEALREKKVDAAEHRAEIEQLLNKRKRLGAINFAADNELSETSEQLDKLQHEREDVETAMTELQTIIRRLDSETRTRLRDMYDSVNQRFAALFQNLIGGGEAMLAMEGDSILDAGFEIRARLPGKRLFPVRMLSGGEKSATALAFVFALMQKTLPPFCIMDEVDAALDDSRVESFVSLLRELSADFQCIVITHNKNTIEAMDALIGVTQEEKGVSKVVSVQLDEALRHAM
jgi:chromosome segregation protein